jgi:hypothetical protein
MNNMQRFMQEANVTSTFIIPGGSSGKTPDDFDVPSNWAGYHSDYSFHFQVELG